MKYAWIFAVLPALLLTGCGAVTEEMEMPEEAAGVVSLAEPTDILPEPAEEWSAAEPAAFDDITDEEAIRRLYSPYSNAERIPGYYQPEECRNFYSLFLPPETGDPVQALQAEEPNTSMELLAENAVYGLYSFPELDAVPVLLTKQMRRTGEDFAYYDGAFEETDVLAAFDLLAKDRKILARWYVDDPEIKCIAYDFYAVEDRGDGTAELGWYCYLIDRETCMFSLQPEWNQKREIDISGISDEIRNMQEVNDAIREILTEETPAAADGAVTDTELTLEKKEILIGYDAPEIIVRAVPPVTCHPDSVQLVDADTGEVVCELMDDCDFEAHGDDIQGDGWYCNRYAVSTDIDTDPDRSEEKTYRFYAEFTEDNVVHRSETVELLVAETFTDKELDSMEQVRNAMETLTDSNEWKQADTDTRRELAVSCLKTLAEKGLVVPESILASDDMVSYQYAAGGSGGIKLTPFDPRMN